MCVLGALLLSLGRDTRALTEPRHLSARPQLEGLALALQHRLPGVFDEHRPTVPAWAQPSSTSRTTDAPSDPATEAEELSYWASVKETLDREAEEDRVERRGAWERMRKRASAVGQERVV